MNINEFGMLYVSRDKPPATRRIRRHRHVETSSSDILLDGVQRRVADKHSMK